MNETDEDYQELLRIVENLKGEIERLDNLFQSLTPGGSEFVKEPEKCVAYAKESRSSLFDALKRKDRIIKQMEALAEEMAEAGDKISNHHDVMTCVRTNLDYPCQFCMELTIWTQALSKWEDRRI